MSETATLKVGDDAPDFELPSSPTGEKFKLSDYKGKNAVVINFLPAAFSPACSNQVPLINSKREEFAAQDAIPVVISSDGAWTQAAWKKQLGVDFPILSDFFPLGDTAKKYGVAIEPRMVANRVVIVVDKHGKVAWIQPTEKITDMPDYDPVLACSKDSFAGASKKLRKGRPVGCPSVRLHHGHSRTVQRAGVRKKDVRRWGLRILIFVVVLAFAGALADVVLGAAFESLDSAVWSVIRRFYDFR